MEQPHRLPRGRGAHNLARNGGGVHGGSSESTEEVIENEESEVYAVLFPWFAEIVGVFVYYILSRYVNTCWIVCGVIC